MHLLASPPPNHQAPTPRHAARSRIKATFTLSATRFVPEYETKLGRQTDFYATIYYERGPERHHHHHHHNTPLPSHSIVDRLSSAASAESRLRAVDDLVYPFSALVVVPVRKRPGIGGGGGGGDGSGSGGARLYSQHELRLGSAMPTAKPLPGPLCHNSIATPIPCSALAATVPSDSYHYHVRTPSIRVDSLLELLWFTLAKKILIRLAPNPVEATTFHVSNTQV